MPGAIYAIVCTSICHRTRCECMSCAAVSSASPLPTVSAFRENLRSAGLYGKVAHDGQGSVPSPGDPRRQPTLSNYRRKSRCRTLGTSIVMTQALQSLLTAIGNSSHADCTMERGPDLHQVPPGGLHTPRKHSDRAHERQRRLRLAAPDCSGDTFARRDEEGLRILLVSLPCST